MTFRHVFAPALALALVASVAPAQQRWERHYGTANNENVGTVVQTLDGGYAAAGSWYDGPWLLRLDSLGDTLWTRTFARRFINSLIETPDSGLVMAGYMMNASDDISLVRTNAQGDTLWTRLYGGSDYERGNCVRAVPGGGFAIGGYTVSYGAGSADYYLIRTDDNGDTLWTRTYGGPAIDICNSVALAADGGYLLAGRRWLLTVNDQVWLVKTDSTGEQLWAKYYGGSGLYNDEATCVQPTTDGGFVVVAFTYAFEQSSQAWILRLDSDGDTLWTRVYGGDAADAPRAVVVTPNGGCVVCGTTVSYGAGGEDVWLLGLDSHGDTLWTRTYGGTGNENAFGMALARDGGYIIAGLTTSFLPRSEPVAMTPTSSRPTSEAGSGSSRQSRRRAPCRP
jgi:hypothetical protein